MDSLDTLLKVHARQERTLKLQADPEAMRAHRLLTDNFPPEWIDSFKLLRVQVLTHLEKHGWKALAITSPGPQEGKTLTACNLALCTAMEYGRTVLLVDANFRHPSVHQAFGLPEPTRGLRDYLLDKTPLPELLIHPGIPNLVLLPAGKPVQYSSELLRSPRMAELVQELKHRYADRIVVFDLPEVLGKPDVPAFVPYVDAVLLVVGVGRTKRSALAEALKYLGEAPLVGTVLNQLRA